MDYGCWKNSRRLPFHSRNFLPLSPKNGLTLKVTETRTFARLIQWSWRGSSKHWRFSLARLTFFWCACHVIKHKFPKYTIHSITFCILFKESTDHASSCLVTCCHGDHISQSWLHQSVLLHQLGPVSSRPCSVLPGKCGPIPLHSPYLCFRSY